MNITALRLPPACVTGIGSLPFTDAAEAVKFVQRWSPEFPFWPQLPQRGPFENIVPQFLGSLLAEHVTRKAQQYEIAPEKLDSFLNEVEAADGQLSPGAAAGFFAFERAVSGGKFPAAVAVKGQIEGPLTLAASLLVLGKPLLLNSEGLATLTRYLVRSATWQIQRLRAAAGDSRPVAIFVDEPVLTVATRPTFARHRDVLIKSVSSLLQGIRQAGATAGLHCCAERPLELMAEVSADVYSFDAYSQLELLFDSPAGKQLLESGRFIALGLVPVVSDPNDYPADFVPLLFDYLKRTAGEKLAELADRGLITTACGLGLANSPTAERAFESCRELSAAMRAR